jgi:hypothetical protein
MTGPAQTNVQALIHIRDELAPQDIHDDVWRACMSNTWYFGQISRNGGLPFWRMDLDDNPAIKRLWDHAKPVCEQKVGRSLTVLNQYANGQTYGNEGSIHRDDAREGAYTFLYYPMKAWREEWDGETVYQNGQGEIIMAVKPMPNRAILFDSRIPHVGRAPSRSFQGLRVTVAFKLLASQP